MTTGEVVGRWENGEAAVVENCYGKGKTFALGTNLSSAFLESRDDKMIQLLNALLQKANVNTQVGMTSGVTNIAIRLLTYGASPVVFVFNDSDETQIVQITKPIFQDPVDLFDVAQMNTNNSEGVWFEISPRQTVCIMDRTAIG